MAELQEVLLTIEKPAAGGRMIARHEGRVILVRGAIPGEVARVRLDEVRRGVAYGTAVEILQPVPDRRPVEGDPACGGCDYAHIEYARQLSLKSEIVADAFARIGRIRLETPVPVAGSPERGYRMRARLHVRGGRVGFFREGTHTLCDAAATNQLSPATAACLPALSGALRALGPHAMTAIDLAENIPGDQRALHVELAPGSSVEPGRFAPLAVDAVRGVSVSARRSAPPLVAAGDPAVADRVADLLPSRADAESAVLRRHPAAFFQSNRFLLPALVEWVMGAVPDGAVVDLYAGVGLFALTLASVGRAPVVAVEGDPISAADLRANAATFGDRIAVHELPVEQFLRSVPAAPATVIVDPPRTGLSADAFAALVAWRPPRLVYVSCDVATLARDARRLVEGGYRLDALQAFDLFPATAHVEVGAIFNRRQESGIRRRTQEHPELRQAAR